MACLWSHKWWSSFQKRCCTRRISWLYPLIIDLCHEPCSFPSSTALLGMLFFRTHFSPLRDSSRIGPYNIDQWSAVLFLSFPHLPCLFCFFLLPPLSPSEFLVKAMFHQSFIRRFNSLHTSIRHSVHSFAWVSQTDLLFFRTLTF